MRQRAVVILALSVLALTYLYGRVDGGDLAWFLFYSAAALFLLNAVACYLTLLGVEIKREVAPGWLLAGGFITVRLEVKKVLPLLPANLILAGSLPALLQPLAHGQNKAKTGFSRQWESRCRVGPLPRGIYAFHSLELKAVDYFALFTRRRIFPSAQEIVVYPAPARLPSWPRGLRGLRGSSPVLHRHSDETIGVRDYAPGDRLQFVHWPATAHSTSLKAREFAAMTQAGQAIVLLDNWHEHYQGARERLEEALGIASALIYYCQERGWPTGLVTGGAGARVEIEPACGRGHLARLLRELAGLELQKDYSPVRLLSGETARALPGTTIFLVTAALSPDLVAALGRADERASLEVFPARENRLDCVLDPAGRGRRLLLHPPVFPEGYGQDRRARRRAGKHASC